MGAAKAITLTLEFNIVMPICTEDDVSVIAEIMMQGAVDRTSVTATGTGFNYNYTEKKSRRGMTITSSRKSINQE